MAPTAAIEDTPHPTVANLSVTTTLLPNTAFIMHLPGTSRTVDVSVHEGTICTSSTGKPGYTLRPLPSIKAPPASDNTILARATRAPAYTLISPSWTNETAFADAIYALFTIRHDIESIRLELLNTQLWRLVLCSGLGTQSPVEPEKSVLLLREAFWQGALSPQFIRHAPTSDFPLIYAFTGTGMRHPLRQPKPLPGSMLYERWIPHLNQTFSIRVVDPKSDADVRLFNKWQNDPRVAAAWFESGTFEEHRIRLEQTTADNHILPVFAAMDGEDFLYGEIYWLVEDHLAPHVGDIHPYSRGWHALVGLDKYRGERYLQTWMSSIAHYAFLSDTRTVILNAEPRASNHKIIEYTARFTGGCVLKTFDFSYKRSALMQVSRERFFQLAPFHWSGKADPLKHYMARL